MYDLQAEFEECVKNLNWIGIYPPKVESVTVNYRAKRFGQCKRRNGKFSINISYRLLDDRCPLSSLRETIFHEFIHTLQNFFNHGAEFKRYASIINDCYGVDISRCSTYEEKFGKDLGNEFRTEIREKKQAKMKTYRCICSKCGYIYKKQGYRAPKWYLRPTDYTHRGCGGRLVSMSNEYLENLEDYI